MEPPVKLDGLASDAASIEKDGGGFMKPGEKRKRGRPKKESGERPDKASAKPEGSSVSAPIDPIAELMPITETVVKLYSNALQMYAEDERARPDENTQKIMSHASAVCLNQYFPNSFGSHAALILLATTVGTTSFNAWVLRRENLEKLKKEFRERYPNGKLDSNSINDL